MSSDDLFEESVAPTLSEHLTPPSLGSTPIECSGVVGAAAASVDVNSLNASGEHVCPECNKVLKTKSGFTRHLVLHKLNHYNARKPLEDDIVSSLPDVLKKVLDEIQEEPTPTVSSMGVHKKEFVAGLIANINSAKVFELVETISRPIIDSVLSRNKVMPSAQYEEALRKVNILLSNSAFCENVKLKLALCVPEELRNKPDSVLRRLTWRMTTKFLQKIQEAVFRHMKEKHLAAHDQYTMQEREMEVFKQHIGKVLRAVYKFGMTSKNPTWNLRCKSMRERFVNSMEALSNDQSLASKMWEENFITLSDAALKLFLGIEKIIQSIQNSGSACNADIVFESATNVENLVLLNSMRDLSSGILSEDLALTFFQDLIKNVVTLSGKLDASRKLQKASKKQRTSTVSLRTNLKRNPTKPVEEDPDDPCQASSSSGMKGRKTSVNVASPVTPVPGSVERPQDNPPKARVSRRKGTAKSSSVASPSPPVAGLLECDEDNLPKGTRVSHRKSTKKSLSIDSPSLPVAGPSERQTAAQPCRSSRTSRNKSTPRQEEAAKPASKPTRFSTRKKYSNKKYSDI